MRLHRHRFRCYELRDIYGVYFVGYRCRCGEEGYGIP